MGTVVEWVIALAALILAGVVWDGIGASMNPRRAVWYQWAVRATYQEWLDGAKNSYRRQDINRLRMMLIYTNQAFRLSPDELVSVKNEVLRYMGDLKTDIREEF